jgi:hypothetical protein
MVDLSGVLWRYRPGTRELENLGPERPLSESLYHHDGVLNDVALSPDGRRIACADGIGGRLVFDRVSGKELWKIQGQRGSGVLSSNPIEFSPDGGLVVFPARKTSSEPWNETARLEGRLALDGRELWPAVRCATDVQALAFAPDGRWLAVATPRSLHSMRGVSDEQDVSVLLLDARGRRRAGFRGMNKNCQQLAFRPDGRYLVASGYECPLYVWEVPEDPGSPGQGSPIEPPPGFGLDAIPDLDAEYRRATFRLGGRTGGLGFTDDGDILAVTEGGPPIRRLRGVPGGTKQGEVFVLPPVSAGLTDVHPRPDAYRHHRRIGLLQRLCFDGEELIELHGEEGFAVWSLGASALEVRRQLDADQEGAPTWACGGSVAMTADFRHVDESTGELGEPFFPPWDTQVLGGPQASGFSPGGRLAMVRTFGGALFVRDLRTGAIQERPVPPHESRSVRRYRWGCRAIHACADSAEVLIPTPDGVVLLDCDAPLGPIRRLAAGHDFFSLASAPDGTRVGLSQDHPDAPVRLWVLVEGAERWLDLSPAVDPAGALTVGGGRAAVSVGDAVGLIELADLRIERMIPTPDTKACVALSPSGRRLALAPRDVGAADPRLEVYQLDAP